MKKTPNFPLAPIVLLFVFMTLASFLPAASRFIERAYAQTQVTGNGPFTLMNFFEGSGPPFGTCTTAFNYGLFYWDHSNNNIWVCAADGWTEASGGGGGGGTPIEHDIAFSSTPALFAGNMSTSTIVLTGAVTAPTIPGGLAATCITVVIKQGAGGPWTFAWPSNMKGGMLVTAGRNSQMFCYYTIDAVWLANGPGVTGE